MATSLIDSQAAHNNYATRPADERFASVADLIAAARGDQRDSREIKYPVRDLKIRAATVPVWTGGEWGNSSHESLLLESPTLDSKGNPKLANLTHWAFGQLAKIIGAPAGYLRELDPGIAAQAMNDGLRKVPKESSANLLVKLRAAHEPLSTIRAATSDTYARLWDADVYQGLQEMILDHDPSWGTPPTWTGEPAGAYRGDRSSFVIVVNGGSWVTDPTRINKPDGGQMFRGILQRNSEVGAASYIQEYAYFRGICGNHLLWGATMDRQFRRRHVGRDLAEDAMRELGRGAREWTQASVARDEAIIKVMIEREIAATEVEVIAELVKLGASKAEAIAAYATCVETEEVSPRSMWGALQGITRVSQARSAGHQDERFGLDQIGAELIRRASMLVPA